MSYLPSLPESGKTFLLIDGAKVNGLSQIIYCDEESPRCDALYRETELSGLSEISPWLVETETNSALARKCFDDWKHLGAAIVLQADCPFEELVDHLRGLLMARLATGDEVVFRFYDPEIARFLLSHETTGEGKSRLMGPCGVIAIQDRRTGEWEYFDNDQPASEKQKEVFTIGEAHQIAMEKAA